MTSPPEREPDEQRVVEARDITPEWLGRRLLAGGYAGHVSDVRVGSPVRGQAGTLYFLQVSASSDAVPADLVLKVYYPERFGGGLNEVLLYQELLPRDDKLPLPECYDIQIDYEASYCHLLTRNVGTTHRSLNRLMSRDELAVVVRSLAELHCTFWNDPCLSADYLQVPQGGTVGMIQAVSRADLDRLAGWLLDDVLPAFVNQYRDFLSAERVRLLETTAASWPELYGARLADRRDLTVIHGDCHWENVFLPRADGEVCFIDWETFKCAPGVYDLTYLLISARSTEQRRSLELEALDLYERHLGGPLRYGRAELESDYRLSVVANVLVALAWRRLGALNDAISAFFDWDCEALVA